MKNAYKKTLLSVIVAGLAACGTVPGLSDLGAYKTGTQISDAQLGQITDRKSTQADVVALVGQPARKAQVGNKEIWYYDFNQIGQAYIGKNINETTAFEFNSKGVVVAHYKTNGVASNPLLKAAGSQ